MSELKAPTPEDRAAQSSLRDSKREGGWFPSDESLGYFRAPLRGAWQEGAGKRVAGTGMLCGAAAGRTAKAGADTQVRPYDHAQETEGKLAESR